MYGLIGYPLGHSFSAIFFNDKFKREGINEQYKLFPVEDIGKVIDIVSHNDIKGFNVTIPYKEKIIKYLDSISNEAKEIGAVNVVKVINNSEGKLLKGFNTDEIGFRESLKSFIDSDIRSALILGTGGASKAVAYSLKKLDIKYKFVSRKHSADFVTYEELDKDLINSYRLIINTTPVGMFPDIDQVLPFPFEFLSRHNLCYDLIYNPEETVFLKKSREKGARIKNGKEMLIKQAEAAWNIWNQK